MAPTTEAEVYREDDDGLAARPIDFEELVAKKGPSLGELYERAIEKTDQARGDLHEARKAYERAHTEELRLKLQLSDLMQARAAEHQRISDRTH